MVAGDAALLERCRSLRSELVRFDPALFSGQDCRALAEELARTEKSCAAARARAAARVAECGSFREGGFDDAADWLSRKTGSSRGDANAAIKTAEAAEKLPATKEALLNGQLSLAQANEITKTEEQCPGSETELVGLAEKSSLADLKNEGRKRRAAAIPAEELADHQHKARSFRHWVDEMGMIRFSGAFAPLVGIPLANRIEAETDRLVREARRQGHNEPREAYAADALANMLSGQGRGSGRRADVVIVCDLRAYRRGHAEEGETCHVMGGGPVPASAAREAAEGDAFIKAVIHDGKKIDTVVHYGRHISAELRTALDLGDPPGFEGVVCVEPGCGRRYGLEWDHVDPVANGGPTSYRNLKPRCWRCHQDKTRNDRIAGLFGNGRAGPFDDEAEPDWSSWDEPEDDAWAAGPEFPLRRDVAGADNGCQ